MQLTRRVFLKGGGVAMLGFSALPAFLQRAVAQTPMPNRKILVALFQRGAMDGLNAVVPHAEPNYYRLRPSIAIPRPVRLDEKTAIDLDGRFGLHPSLSPLEELFKSKQLAIVHAVGSPDTTRSHFDAQDYMESGTPGLKSTEDGWLNRHLQCVNEEDATPFRGVAMGTNLPRALKGVAPALALPDVRQFQVMAQSPVVAGGFEAIYAQTVDQALRGTGTETFEAIDMLKKADPQRYQPENDANYPRSRFGQSLLQVAQLIKANIGLEVAFLDSGGWDHHTNEGSTQGQIANLLRDLGQGLAAFHRDLGQRMENVVFVTMSEFGRTAHENGNRGNDHRPANRRFVMGGDVAGGEVDGRWSGRETHQLYEGRDLAVTTDFRTVLGELLARHMGNNELRKVFPGFNLDPKSYLGLVKA